MSDIQANIVNGEITAKGMGFFQRLVGVIFSPGKVMEELAAKPRIIFALILTAFAQLTLIVLRMPLYMDFLRKTMTATSAYVESLTGTKLTPEMIEQNLAKSRIQSIITTPLTALFMWVLITVIIFAIVKIGGGKGKFKQYLSVTGYAYVISALYLLITLAVSYFTGSLHLEMPLTSIGNLFGSEMKGSFIFGVLKGIDIFSIWYYAVIAIGTAIVSGFKKRTTYGIVAGIFIVGLIIAGAGEAAMGALL